MRHHRRSTRLGVKTPHRAAMLRNLTLGLIEHGRIKTTAARARSLRPFVEKLVTRLKSPTLHNLRIAQTQLPNRAAVLNLARNIVPKFMTRPGGYLRILKLATPRAGDAADMALIEWVEESLVAAYNEPKPKAAASKKAKGKSGASKGKTAGAEKKTKSAEGASAASSKAKKKGAKES